MYRIFETDAGVAMTFSELSSEIMKTDPLNSSQALNSVASQRMKSCPENRNHHGEFGCDRIVNRVRLIASENFHGSRSRPRPLVQTYYDVVL